MGPVNVLMLGSGKGAWIMRGEQLGAALGARVKHEPSPADWQWADVCVLVKRAGPLFTRQAHAHQVPIVWDALDFWRQPDQNHLNEKAAHELLQNTIKIVRPALVIGATQAMAEAAGGVYLPHHGWTGLQPTPAREAIQTVGYDGGEQYLGRWRGWLSDACRSRGWKFVINPPDLSTVDLLVAFRDGTRDGWICRQWKSGVKFVNAILAGRPIIRQASAASEEIGAPGSVVETHAELVNALDAWTPHEQRHGIMARCEELAPRYALSTVAALYDALLTCVQNRAVA